MVLVKRRLRRSERCQSNLVPTLVFLVIALMAVGRESICPRREGREIGRA